MNNGFKYLLSVVILAGCASPPPTPPQDPQFDPGIQLEHEQVSEQHMRIHILLREKNAAGLVELLAYPDTSVVAAAAEALVAFDNPIAAPHLEQRLDMAVTAVLLEIEKGRSPPLQPVHSLVYAVLHFTRPESAYVLSRATRLPFARVRRDAVKGIRLSRSPDRFVYLQEAFSALVTTGVAPDAEAEAELPEYVIIDAIGRIRTPEALEFLLKVLQHERADLRLRAGRSLAPYHDLFPERFDPLRFRVTGKEGEK